MTKANQQGLARWIWISSPKANAPNQYVDFRLETDLPQLPKGATLRISVDTDFAAWVNGQFAGCGQFTDFPERRTFSELDIAELLHPGRNVIAIPVHYCGEDHFSYLPGDAGLWCELEIDGMIVALSDAGTLCRTSPSYQLQTSVRINSQRGFTFHYDAACDDDWKNAKYVPGSDWQPVIVCRVQGQPHPRPLGNA